MVAAGVDAVHAGDAAAVVYPVVLEVDAGGFALAAAQAARVAFLRVDAHPQEREAREEAQHRAHGADGVAIGAPAPPGQDGDDDQRGRGDEKRRQALHPHARLIERIAVGPFGQVGQDVVSPAVERGEEVLRDAPVGTIGGQQGDQRADAGHEGDDEDREHAVAQPALLGRITEAVAALLRASAQPGDDVLHHAHRADDRTVDTPEDERQDDEEHDDSHIQRQHRRQELYAGHPAEPRVDRPREVEEEQRDAGEKHDG